MSKEVYTFKIIVVGDPGVGKTSLIQRYAFNQFSNTYKATIGVDFAMKELPDYAPNVAVKLQLWDIAGQELYRNLTRVFYKEAVGAIVVFDITRNDTFENVLEWKKDIDDKVMLPGQTQPIPCLLVANKSDLPNQISKTPEEFKEFCIKHNFIGWFETSAKKGSNIAEATKFLVDYIFKKHKEILNATAKESNSEQNVQLVNVAERNSNTQNSTICCMNPVTKNAF